MPSLAQSFCDFDYYHMMLASTSRVSGGVLWANLHLLFWLSLVPFATGWMGENHFVPATLAVYGVMLLMSGVAYWILQSRIVALEGPNSTLARAIGRNFKGLSSPPLYVAGIAASFWQPLVAGGIYVAVALMWLIPDQRIERTLVDKA